MWKERGQVVRLGHHSRFRAELDVTLTVVVFIACVVGRRGVLWLAQKVFLQTVSGRLRSTKKLLRLQGGRRTDGSQNIKPVPTPRYQGRVPPHSQATFLRSKLHSLPFSWRFV